MTSETTIPVPDSVLVHDQDLKHLIHDSMKSKSRSHETHHGIHLPILNQEPTLMFNTVLIGDSMIERFKTTGSRTRIAQLPASFNAGVGGDRIENVLYRLDLGLLDALRDRGIRLWVLIVGTNQIGGKKKGMKKKELDAYRVLIQALLSIAPKSRVLACGVFYRKDVDDGNIDLANEMLKGTVGEINKNREEEGVY